MYDDGIMNARLAARLPACLAWRMARMENFKKWPSRDSGIGCSTYSALDARRSTCCSAGQTGYEIMREVSGARQVKACQAPGPVSLESQIAAYLRSSGDSTAPQPALHSLIAEGRCDVFC